MPELPGDAHAHVIDVAALKLQGSGGEGTAFMPEPLPADDPFAVSWPPCKPPGEPLACMQAVMANIRSNNLQTNRQNRFRVSVKLV